MNEKQNLQYLIHCTINFSLITDHSKKSTVMSSAVGDIPSSQFVSDGINCPEAVYQKVRNFLEVNRNLRSMMQTLQAQNESLVTSNTELKKMAEDIRRQAVDALK
jgi:hypothetical protein